VRHGQGLDDLPGSSGIRGGNDHGVRGEFEGGDFEVPERYIAAESTGAPGNNNARFFELRGDQVDFVREAAPVNNVRRAAEQALLASQRRKERFFVGDKAGYSDLEDIFLAMEGLAMWVQYRTARERAPSGEDWLTTFISLAQKTDAWSQQDGLALLILIERLAPGWHARFLAPDFPSPFTVLREAIRGRSRLDRRFV
jgi:hypothetical protein